MLEVIIQNKLYFVPRKTRAGQIATQEIADFFNYLSIKQIEKKIYSELKKGTLKVSEIPQKIEELSKLPLEMKEEISEILMVEAKTIAREMLMKQFLKQNLPEPSNLEEQIQILIDRVPEIIERAKIRLQTLHAVPNELLKGKTNVSNS